MHTHDFYSNPILINHLQIEKAETGLLSEDDECVVELLLEET